MNEVQTHRETAQPIREKTGGSTFKNPPGNSAWKLIDAAGCRGLRVGGAQVSEMHCNFLINTGNATGHDIETLGETVRERVKANSGIELHWEIKRIDPDQEAARLMRITILFGGTNKERLVSVASAQALHRALPEADLWFWDVADTVHEVASQKLLAHARPFEDEFKPDNRGLPLEAALDKAQRRGSRAGARPAWRPRRERRVAGDVRTARHSLHRVRLGVVEPRLRQVGGETVCGDCGCRGAGRDSPGKPRRGICRIRQADRKAGAGRLELWPDLRQRETGPRRGPQRRQDRRISDRAVRRGRGGNLWRAGAIRWHGDVAPPIEIVPGEGAFDYTAKYLLKSTQEICPGRFSPEISAQLKDQALRAHKALSCSGYSRTDFIVSAKGLVYLETNTLPGLTAASLYPKALKAQGIEFPDFLRDQIDAGRTAQPGTA